MKICNLGFKNIVNKVLFCIYTNPNMFLDIKFLTLSWLDEVYFVLNVIINFNNLICFRSFSPLQWTMNIWQRFACWSNENQQFKNIAKQKFNARSSSFSLASFWRSNFSSNLNFFTLSVLGYFQRKLFKLDNSLEETLAVGQFFIGNIGSRTILWRKHWQ